MTSFNKYQKIVENINYVAMNGGRWEIENHQKALTEYYYLSIAKNNNWNCICAKTAKADSHRLWFDCDSSKEPTEKILDNINMILIDNLIEPNTRSLITMNIGANHKRHIKYPDIYVNNSIRKALVQKINEKFGSDYVDDNANCGLRLELTNKYDKKNKTWIENSRYVKENGEDLTIEELTGEYNILKEGEIIGIQKGLVKEVQKKQKQSKCKNTNTNDLPEWVKSQIEKIKQNDRFKDMTAEGIMLNDMYVLNLCQGFVCPFIGRAHTSNRNKVEIYENSCVLGCHKCNKRENLFLECLIDVDVEEEDEFFDVNKFNEIELDDGEGITSTNKDINELEEKIDDINEEIFKLDEIDPDTLSKIEKKKNKNIIKRKKNEIKKLEKQLKKLEKIQEKEEKLEEKIQRIGLVKKRIPYFEKFHCKILSPFCYIEKRRNQIEMYKHMQFINKNKNLMRGEFIDEWTKQSDIRTYDRMDFYPPPLKVPDGVFNSYTGLRIDNIKSYKESDFSRITDHIKLMVGVNETTGTGYNEKGYEYMLNYLSHMVQKMGQLPRVALVFKGLQGTGKNIFWNNFGKSVFGDNLYLTTAKMDQVVGRFAVINQKFLVILDEASGKDGFLNSDKIKNIITEDTITFEKKGVQVITINNCARYIFLTNNDTPIKIEMSDRRFVVFEMNPEKKNNSKYFSELVKDFENDDVVMSFVNFLKNRDISNWNSIGDRPITKVYQDMQSVNVPLMVRFIKSWYYENYNKLEIRYLSRRLFNDFNRFMTEGHFNFEMNVTNFGREIIKIQGISKKRTNKGQMYILDRLEIEKYLLNNKFIDEIQENISECLIEEDCVLR